MFEFKQSSYGHPKNQLQASMCLLISHIKYSYLSNNNASKSIAYLHPELTLHVIEPEMAKTLEY